MRGLWLVARRDLAAYFNTYWGYVVLALILVLDGLLFNAFALGEQPKYSATVLEHFFYFSFGLTLIATVLITMGSVAEERQSGTMALIDASPLTVGQFIGGKYVAAMFLMALLLLATLYMPAMIFINGKVSYGQIFAGYLGLLLVAGAGTAIGVFASVISRHHLVAAVMASAIIGCFVISWLLARILEPPLSDIIEYLSFYERHFRGFGRGQIHGESIVFFVSIAFVFLTTAIQILHLRRLR